MEKQKQNFALTVLTVVMLVGVGLGMGILIRNGHADFAPLVIPVGMVIAVLIGLPILLSGGKPSDDPGDEKTREAAALDKIQTSRGAMANKLARTEYEIANIHRLQGTATKAGIIGTVLALSLIVASLVAVVIGVIVAKFVVVIVGAVGFTLTIAISLIVMVSTENALVKPIDPATMAAQKMTGTVVACAAQSTRYVGRDLNGKRVQQVTYRVKITAGDQTYLSFSHTFYNAGDQVEFVPRRNRLCTIIENVVN